MTRLIHAPGHPSLAVRGVFAQGWEVSLLSGTAAGASARSHGNDPPDCPPVQMWRPAGSLELAPLTIKIYACML